MGREEVSAIKTREIKRLVADGVYRIDPVQVADAMIRHGNRVFWGHQRPLPIVHLPQRERDPPP
jgi:hypothetical protein